MMDKKEILGRYIDSIINKKFDESKEIYAEYVKLKGRDNKSITAIQETVDDKVKDSDADEEDEDDSDEDYSHLVKGNRVKAKAPLKKMKKMDEAAVLKEFTGEDSPIKLKGDDVFVNGKMVGTITNDLSDIDSGIIFSSADGNFKQEFDSIKDLYAFLVSHFNIQGEMPLDADEE